MQKFTQCRHFTGYKPCHLNLLCDNDCPQLNVPQTRVLVIHLGALGAVVRSTALLKSIHRKYPKAHITWVTDAPAHHLLLHNSMIDRVLTTSMDDQLILSVLQFDIGMVIDKSLRAVSLLKKTQVDLHLGFSCDSHSGAITPATPAAEELWCLGLSDAKKFYLNKKTENQLVHEALELDTYMRDSYHVPLSEAEKKEVLLRNEKWKLSPGPIIGFNTGCASTLPAKKWTVEFHRKVIQKLNAQGFTNLVLLGGKEDELRNQQISFQMPVLQSNTQLGLRDGLVSVAACDIILSGDSLGMHLAISQNKFVIAWFGPSCIQEIDLYDRGVKIQSKAACSPCWKKSCDQNPMCYDLVEMDDIVKAVEQGVQWYQNQLCSIIKKQLAHLG